MRLLVNDARYGLRVLVRAPGFAAAAVLTVGLGIGATTAMFSVVRTVLLTPLPYDAPDRLVTIWEANRARGLEHEPISPVNFLDYRSLSHVFSDAAAWWRPQVTLHTPGQEPLRVNTIEVSGNFLSVLGRAPALGAGFPAGVLNAPDRMVLISHRLWQARFGSDPAVIGRDITLNDDRFTVVAVMPEGFHYPGDTDVWERLNWDLSRHSRGAHFMEAVARLRPGVEPADARRELTSLSARLGAEYVSTNGGWEARVVALHDEVVGAYRPALLVLLAAVALLLLIASFNVASLLLARAVSRAREVAVRAAVGATRARLARQFLTESVILGAAGTAIGIPLAFALMRAVARMSPVDVPRLADATVDGAALGFAAMLATVTVLVFGLLPAMLLSSADPHLALKEAGRWNAGSRGRGRAHRALVAAEVGLAVMLLAGAGLLVRTVAARAAENPGVRPEGVLTAGVQLTGAAYEQWPQVEQFYVSLTQALREQPGVAAAGVSNFLPLAAGWRVPFLVRGVPAPPRGDEPTAQYHSVSDGYFEAVGASLRQGRFFDARDDATSRGVVIVNEALARRYFPGENPVGKTVESLTRNIGPLGASLMQERGHEIVGVVTDIRNTSLQGAAEPALYHTQRQFPFRHMYVAVRGRDEAVMSAVLRNTLRRLDPLQPPPDIRPMRDVVAAAVDRPRFLMYMLAVFSASAALLAGLGIYGLLAYAVTQRQQELSIRMALGARRPSVVWNVVRQALALALIGTVAGLAGAFAVARQVAGMLYGVTAADPLTFAVVAALALAIAFGACAVPAARAARINPLDGLRE